MRETKDDLRRRLREAEDRALRAEAERDAYRHALGVMRGWMVTPPPAQPTWTKPIDLTPTPIWVAPDPLRDGGPIWVDPNYLPPAWWSQPVDLTPKVTWAPGTWTGGTITMPLGEAYTRTIVGGSVTNLPTTRYSTVQ